MNKEQVATVIVAGAAVQAAQHYGRSGLARSKAGEQVHQVKHLASIVAHLISDNNEQRVAGKVLACQLFNLGLGDRNHGINEH